MENSGTPKPPQKRKPPTPQELLSHYESQGLDSQSAALKVIDDLHSTLLRVVSSGRRGSGGAAGRKGGLGVDNASRKLELANARLTIMDAKLDSKPGYAETFALGIASGLTLNGLSSAFPHVVGAVSQIWNSARSLTKD